MAHSSKFTDSSASAKSPEVSAASSLSPPLLPVFSDGEWRKQHKTSDIIPQTSMRRGKGPGTNVEDGAGKHEHGYDLGDTAGSEDDHIACVASSSLEMNRGLAHRREEQLKAGTPASISNYFALSNPSRGQAKLVAPSGSGAPTKKRAHDSDDSDEGPSVAGSSSIVMKEDVIIQSYDASDVSNRFEGFRACRNKRQHVAGEYTGNSVSRSAFHDLIIHADPVPSSVLADAAPETHKSSTSSLVSYESNNYEARAPEPAPAPVSSVAPSSAHPSARWDPSLFTTPITFAGTNGRYDPLSAPIKYSNPDASIPDLDADITLASTSFEGDDSRRTDFLMLYNDLESYQYRSVDELTVATRSHKHHFLYWEDGDVIVHCGAIIFRVHREVLVEHSWMYREMLGQDGDGMTMSAQRELPGVKVYIHDEGVWGETVEDYEFLLVCFYRPSDLKQTSYCTVPKLERVLNLSQKYSSIRIHEFGICVFSLYAPTSFDGWLHLGERLASSNAHISTSMSPFAYTSSATAKGNGRAVDMGPTDIHSSLTVRDKLRLLYLAKTHEVWAVQPYIRYLLCQESIDSITSGGGFGEVPITGEPQPYWKFGDSEAEPESNDEMYCIPEQEITELLQGRETLKDARRDLVFGFLARIRREGKLGRAWESENGKVHRGDLKGEVERVEKSKTAATSWRVWTEDCDEKRNSATKHSCFMFLIRLHHDWESRRADLYGIGEGVTLNSLGGVTEEAREIVKENLCPSCWKKFKNEMRQGQRKVWRELPHAVGLRNWFEVARMAKQVSLAGTAGIQKEALDEARQEGH